MAYYKLHSIIPLDDILSLKRHPILNATLKKVDFVCSGRSVFGDALADVFNEQQKVW